MPEDTVSKFMELNEVLKTALTKEDRLSIHKETRDKSLKYKEISLSREYGLGVIFYIPHNKNNYNPRIKNVIAKPSGGMGDINYTIVSEDLHVKFYDDLKECIPGKEEYYKKLKKTHEKLQKYFLTDNKAGITYFDPGWIKNKVNEKFNTNLSFENEYNTNYIEFDLYDTIYDSGFDEEYENLNDLIEKYNNKDYEEDYEYCVSYPFHLEINTPSLGNVFEKWNKITLKVRKLLLLAGLKYAI